MADILDLEHHKYIEEYKQTLDELIPVVGVNIHIFILIFFI